MNYLAIQAQVQALFQQENFPEAEKGCRMALELIPNDIATHFRLGCVLAAEGRKDEAVKSLQKAVSLGFNNPAMLKGEKALAPLQDMDDFKALLKKSETAKPDPAAAWNYPCEPAEIKDAVAMVTEKNTTYDPQIGILKSFFKFPEPKPDLPVAVGLGEAGDLLRKWYSEKTAAGNWGDLYDNHDGDHSNMDYAAFPQLARIEFGDTPKKKGFASGLQTLFLYNGPTIGNSSTAVTDPFIFRSIPRLALTGGRGQMLFVQYVSNHMYFYPEHADHDPGRNGQGGYGDLIPANTPYYIISQGSSFSDKVFMDAVCAAMASFTPEVKTELVKNGALMPAMQMIFRMSNKTVKSDDDYLSGKAHPSVFDGNQLDMIRMMKMAHDMTADCLPPFVQLKVKEEDQPVPGIDYFGIPGAEKLFDTPCAVARVARSVKYARRMLVSAEDSRDLKGKALSYCWVLLRGDPAKVSIKKSNISGSEAEIIVSWHDRFPISLGNPLESNRVDIGVFAKNHKYFSPPAFISILFNDSEKRTYDSKNRITSVDYNDPAVGKNYVDPMLFTKKNWRDEYHYDAKGAMTGWTRIRADSKEEFTAGGLLVAKTDASGKPIEGRKVNYVVKQNQNAMAELVETPTQETVLFK